MLPKQHSCKSLKAVACYTWAHKQKTKRRNGNVCTFPRTSAAEDSPNCHHCKLNASQLVRSVWFPRQKEPFSSRPCAIPEWSGRKKATFHSLRFLPCFRFPHLCVMTCMEFVFFLPLKVPTHFYILSSTGGRLATADPLDHPVVELLDVVTLRSNVPLTPLLQFCSWSGFLPQAPPKKIWAFGWLESLICPEVRACETRSCARFLPLTRWLLGLAPARPGTLMRNKRWLTENGRMEESDEMIMPFGLASRWAFNNFLLTQRLTPLVSRGPFLTGPPAAHIGKAVWWLLCCCFVYLVLEKAIKELLHVISQPPSAPRG